MKNKSTLEEIEARFDQDVARFSNLDTGQLTTLDAKFNMELITESISTCYPDLNCVLDIGCGAGNYVVSLLQHVSPLRIVLSDLSQPMLDKARERIEGLNVKGMVETIKGDFRKLPLEDNSVDVIIATAVLHHLRDDEDWNTSFNMLYAKLRKGGSMWVFDLMTQDTEELQQVTYQQRYGDYLTTLQDEAYRDHVFDYILKEDSPRSFIYQLTLLQEVGFEKVDILHKNLCFASYVAFK